MTRILTIATALLAPLLLGACVETAPQEPTKVIVQPQPAQPVPAAPPVIVSPPPQ